MSEIDYFDYHVMQMQIMRFRDAQKDAMSNNELLRARDMARMADETEREAEALKEKVGKQTWEQLDARYKM